MRRVSFFSLILFSCFNFANIQGKTTVAKYASAFMESGVGARALAMGGAFVALTEDVTSLYWNPAGLAGMEKMQIHGMHSERFSGIVNWDFIGVGVPMNGRFAVGLGFFRLGIDGIPLTSLRDPSRELGEVFVDESGRRIQNDVIAHDYVNDHEMAFVFSFAKRPCSNFCYGGTIRVIRKSVDAYGAWGIGFDFGMIINPYRSWKLGIVLLDGTTTLVAWDNGRRELITPQLKIGLTTPLSLKSITINPVLDLQTAFRNRGSNSMFSIGRMDVALRTGFEVIWLDRIAMRLGLDRGRLSTGAGLKFSIFSADYGFAHHSDLGNTHRISLTLFLRTPRFLGF